MLTNSMIHACLIVDDFPANATYWWREQQTAFGYKVPESGYGKNWSVQRHAPFMPINLLHAFAEFVDEFDVRGKFTMLPCPAGLGRIDRGVRGLPDGELREIITIVRDQLAARFDITPEVLTHTMAYNPESGALFPHAETAWLTHLCATRREEELCAYLRHAWTILAGVGIHARGITIGGMPDASNIGKGESLLGGHHRQGLAEALMVIEREFNPDVSLSFMYTGSPPLSEESKARSVPEVIHTTANGEQVFEIHPYSRGDDPLLRVFLGDGNPSTETDKLITPDLTKGTFIDWIEAGRVLAISVHAQTLTSLNTGNGLQVLRESVRRLRERYGCRLIWHTPLEMCTVTS